MQSGEITFQELKAQGADWFQSGSERSGQSTDQNIQLIRAAFTLPGTEAWVFLGTWCPDTHKNLPPFLKILELAGVPEARIRLFSLGRDKKLLPWTEDLKISRVPTFVLTRGGHELGRIIEAPTEDLATQIAQILEPSLQERFSPASACFGCGPANPKGLQIRSQVSSSNPGEVVADWMAASHHEAFPGMLNGGIVGALLDCHSNWTAAHHLMKKAGADHPPCTVTADYAISLKRPTPTDGVIHLSARVVDSKEDRATIEATLTAGGKVCATCRGTFVAVKPGHPAYHRW